MTQNHRSIAQATLCAAIFILAACTNAYPPLTFLPDGKSLRLQGVIDARALEAFDLAMETNPNVEQLIFDFVPGSADDESNLKLARKVRALGLKTLIPEDGLTASGGTDLFLAGVDRSVSPSACVGVHTWGNEIVGIGSEMGKDHPMHQVYLDFYREMHIPEAFYWFTLDAAGPDDSYWMPADEIASFDMITDPIDLIEAEPPVERKTRCQIRFDQRFEQLLSGEQTD